MKIVIIGAGSTCFGTGQLADLMQAEEFRGREVELALVDIDAHALDVMARLAGRIKAHTGSSFRITSTTDRTQALPGAKYVITAVAQKRYELWEQDFRVPLAYGFRHCLGENGGPGSIFHTMRSLQLMMPICADIERYCPAALLLNFTNPEARVLHAILHLTQVKAAGICHGVYSAIEIISRYLKRPSDEFEIISAGMNHFYCVLQVREKATGKEWLPELLHMAATDTSPHTPVLFRKMADIFGVFTFPSDDHIGEYLSYGAEFHGVKWPYGRECQPVAKGPQPNPWDIEAYANGTRPIDAHILRPSGEVTVPIIGDIELNRGMFREAVNVLNTEGYISNLPADAAIEVPAIVDAQGIHPLHVGAIPETFAAYMRMQMTIQTLLTEAYRTRSKKLLLQALLLDPNVHSITAAEHLLDDMCRLQGEYLPEFTDDIAPVCR